MLPMFGIGDLEAMCSGAIANILIVLTNWQRGLRIETVAALTPDKSVIRE
jgi:hypothetical protein